MDIQRQRIRGQDRRENLKAKGEVAERRLNLARWLYWSREIRPNIDQQLYGEPAWDMLLDLYLRQKAGTRSSVTSACIGSRAPHTTALRYVSALCDAGWLERVIDETDRRRNWLSLSPEGEARLDRYFDRLLATLDGTASFRLS
jgi:hypothetical protein